VRSATAGQALDISNCQPFRDNKLLFIHNGSIDNFKKSLYRPMRELLCDEIYQLIEGNTDSEHIFALLLNELSSDPDSSIEKALEKTLTTMTALAKLHHVSFSAKHHY
jgi:glutamine amidotransferase